jgi:hypothetical protein
MRMWEILEKHEEMRPRKEYDRDHEYGFRGSIMGMKSSEHDYKKMISDAYDCGFEEGYKKAMEEAEHLGFRYDERRGMR